ncbi:meiotic recombination protein SPO11 [Anabrus simplex]|uniref:meiotic recombination protein SPO11 n=1 Tax=Anabrus simplex TaxID=316456 RepID=UPI0035A302C6
MEKSTLPVRLVDHDYEAAFEKLQDALYTMEAPHYEHPGLVVFNRWGEDNHQGSLRVFDHLNAIAESIGEPILQIIGHMVPAWAIIIRPNDAASFKVYEERASQEFQVSRLPGLREHLDVSGYQEAAIQTEPRTEYDGATPVRRLYSTKYMQTNKAANQDRRPPTKAKWSQTQAYQEGPVTRAQARNPPVMVDSSTAVEKDAPWRSETAAQAQPACMSVELQTSICAPQERERSTMNRPKERLTKSVAKLMTTLRMELNYCKEVPHHGDNGQRETRRRRNQTVPEILQAVDRSIRDINRKGAATGNLQRPQRWQQVVGKAGVYIELLAQLMASIERLVLDVVESVARGDAPHLKIRNRRDWSNIKFGSRVQLKSVGEASNTLVKWSNPRCRDRFSVLLMVLAKSHWLLATRSTCTRRELYYQNVSAVRGQSAIDAAVRDVCCLLEAPSWELGLLATSKGLIAGPLVLESATGEQTDCSATGGTLIPQDVEGLLHLKSQAEFVLVVEKDAIFQKLLDEGALVQLNCLLITGKGFPDVNTRLLLRRLWDDLGIPIWALLDADPYGIEILCIYRFGSLSMSDQAGELAVPATRWIGVHPSELTGLGVPTQPLSRNDVRKLRDLAARPYIQTNPQLKEQVDVLLREHFKAEMEGVANFSSTYLTDVYIPSKICCGEVL